MFAVRFSNGRSAFYETEQTQYSSIDALLARMVRLDGPDWNLYPVGASAMIAESDDASVVISAETPEAAAALAKIVEANALVQDSDAFYDDEDEALLVTGTRLGDIAE